EREGVVEAELETGPDVGFVPVARSVAAGERLLALDAVPVPGVDGEVGQQAVLVLVDVVIDLAVRLPDEAVPLLEDAAEEVGGGEVHSSVEVDVARVDRSVSALRCQQQGCRGDEPEQAHPTARFPTVLHEPSLLCFLKAPPHRAGITRRGGSSNRDAVFQILGCLTGSGAGDRGIAPLALQPCILPGRGLHHWRLRLPIEWAAAR